MKKLIVIFLLIVFIISILIVSCGDTITKKENSSPNDNSIDNTGEEIESVVDFLKKEDIDATKLAYTINIDTKNLNLSNDLEKLYKKLKKTKDISILEDSEPIETFKIFYKLLEDKNSEITLLLICESKNIKEDILKENIESGDFKILKELNNFQGRIVQIRDKKKREYLVFEGTGKYELKEDENQIWKICYIK
jgi:hypothetical protein